MAAGDALGDAPMTRLPPERTLWAAGCIALLVPITLYVMVTFLYGSNFLGMGSRSAQAMIDGTALRPHVYRQLVPLIVRGIMALTPESLMPWVTQGLHDLLWGNPLFTAAAGIRRAASQPELADSR